MTNGGMGDDEFAGWVVMVDTWDAMRPFSDNGRPRLFTSLEAAKAEQGWLDVVSPVTKERFLELGGVLAKSGPDLQQRLF